MENNETKPKDKTTYDSILAWFKNAVETHMPIRAVDWNDAALQLNILREELDDAVIVLEVAMSDEEMRLLGIPDTTAASAKKMCRQVIDYGEYLRAVAKQNRIDEFIRLAKKRAELENRQAFAQHT